MDLVTDLKWENTDRYFYR